MLNGLTEIPRNIRVIVISRADPLPVFTRLQANAVIGTIGWEDLRFTTQETSGEMQQFLVKSSFLPRMTPRMAEEISGIGRAGQILADLNRGNYFTERRAGPEIRFQVNALFPGVLLAA